MKKILVSVSGIGLGHATRSEAVIKELRKKAELRVLTYGPAYEYFKKVGLKPKNFEGYSYKGEEFTFNVLFQIFEILRDPTKLRKDYVLFRKLADEFRPDIILSDSEPNSFYYSYKRFIPTAFLTNLLSTIHDFELIPKKYRVKELLIQKAAIKKLMDFILKRTDEIFVPDISHRLEYVENVKYIDLIVRKRMAQLRPKEALRKKLGIDRDFYLVTIGGAEIEKYLFKLLQKSLPKFKDKYFVVSSNYQVDKVVEKKNMKMFPFITNPLEYLKISNGLISPAGHSSISEALCYRKPVLAVPIKNHIEQMVNAAVIQHEGLGEAGFFERVNEKTLTKNMRNYFRNEEKINENLKKIKFRGQGAKQIANELLKYF